MIRIGTAGWSYVTGKGKWTGVFYPPGRSTDPLSFYAHFFETVEVNSTFYRPIDPKTARTWAEKTPPDFKFSVKLYQKFTHPTMFEAATGDEADLRKKDFDEFIASIGPLTDAGKLGPLLAQFPPSFKASDESMAHVAELAERFKSHQLVVELRHKSWTEDERTAQLIADHRLSWVHVDEPVVASSGEDPPFIGPIAYFRFHGRNWKDWWRGDRDERYNYLYSLREQAQLAQRITAIPTIAPESQTYVAYNNHFGGKAVANALEMKLLLGQEVPDDVPPSLIEAFPDLAELLKREAVERS